MRLRWRQPRDADRSATRVGRIDRSNLGSIGFGVVGPTRATRLSVPSVDSISSRLTRPCRGDARSSKGDGPVPGTGPYLSRISRNGVPRRAGPQRGDVTVPGLRVTVVQKRISLEADPEEFQPQEGHWEAPPLNESLPVLSPVWKTSSTCRCCRGPSPRTFRAPGRTLIRAGRSGPYRRREHHWHRPNQCSSTLLRSRAPTRLHSLGRRRRRRREVPQQ